MLQENIENLNDFVCTYSLVTLQKEEKKAYNIYRNYTLETTVDS
jgi:hypothetical protein